jgi:alanine dehydrogenase
MSEVAGRLSIQEGAKYLEAPAGGRGVLLGGVPGVEPANVVVLGGGVVGTQAARVAAGMGANVTILDVNIDRLRQLDEILPANVTAVYSDPYAIAAYVIRADLVIGAVLVPGKRAPRLVSADLVRRMKPGSVIVDVCIDQGGCFETAHPTTHHSPTYVVDGVVHYCVTNMPGAVGRTSTQALCNATLPFVRMLAKVGTSAFVSLDAGHGAALNLHQGTIVNPQVADAFPDLPRAGLPKSASTG